MDLSMTSGTLKVNPSSSNLPEEDFARPTANQTEQAYSKGEIIFRRVLSYRHFLHSKRAKPRQYKVLENGGEQIIYVCQYGRADRLSCILSEERFTRFGRCTGGKRLLHLYPKRIPDTLQQSPY